MSRSMLERWLGIGPELDPCARWGSLEALAHALDARTDEIDRRDALVLDVEASAAWFRAQGEHGVDISKRPVLRRLLLRLVRTHAEQPGAPCSQGDLVAAGWPGEKMSAAAARNRLHVSLTRLRELGLRDLVVTTPRGHLLRAELVVRVSGDDAGPPGGEAAGGARSEPRPGSR